MISLNISAELGGVYDIAFAPATIVSFIVSLVGPPVAIIGNFGYFSLQCALLYPLLQIKQ